MQCCQALLLCYTLAAAGSLVFADTNGTVNCVPFCLLYTSRFHFPSKHQNILCLSQRRSE